MHKVLEGSEKDLEVPPSGQGDGRGMAGRGGKYVSHHQNMVTQYIANRPITGLCLEVEQLSG